MRKSVFLVLTMLFFFIFGFSAFAQTREEKVIDKKFWTINTLLVSATIYDVETTYYTLSKCQSCFEGNPLMRPLINAGRPWVYAVQGSADAGIIYLSYKMKKDGDNWWPLLPIVVSAVHIVAGTHNFRLTISF